MQLKNAELWSEIGAFGAEIRGRQWSERVLAVRQGTLTSDPGPLSRQWLGAGDRALVVRSGLLLEAFTQQQPANRTHDTGAN